MDNKDTSELRSLTHIEQLQNKQRKLESKLVRITRALDILAKNPEIIEQVEELLVTLRDD